MAVKSADPLTFLGTAVVLGLISPSRIAATFLPALGTVRHRSVELLRLD